MNKTTYIILGVLIIVVIAVLYIRHHIKTEVTASLKRKTAHLQEPLGVDIWCNTKPDIAVYLKELFPETQFFEWDFYTDAPKGYDENNTKHSIYFVNDHSDEPSTYPYELSFYKLNRKVWTYNHIYKLAAYIAKKENNICLVDYINPEFPDSPYYSLLFKDEKTYLVDDSEFDNGNNDVTILKEITL